MVWTSRGTYPYLRREDWWTRFHLLRRKIERSGSLTANDQRVALILQDGVQRLFPSRAPLPRDVARTLSAWSDHGTTTGYEAALDAAANAFLGEDDVHPAAPSE